MLDKHQEKALNACLFPTCKKIYITGAGGTGKSRLINLIKDSYVKCTVLAPTNSASKNINGVTIHTHFKIKPSIDELATKEQDVIRFDMRNRSNTGDEKVIIIDEISMVGKSVLDTLIKQINPDLLIVFGDPEQAPPVKDKKVDWSKFCDETYYLVNNYRAANESIKVMIAKYRSSSILDIPIFDGQFDEKTKFIAFKNTTLSFFQKFILGYIDGRKGDKMITFGSIDKVCDNGDEVVLLQKNGWFTDKKLEKWEIKTNVKTKYKPYVMVGDYRRYKTLLSLRHREAKEVVELLARKYKVDPRKLNSVNNMSAKDRFSLKEAWGKYYEIKNSPYCRHNQFITTYKAQGKGYSDVVVIVDDMPNKEHTYIAISRAMDKLRIIK